MPGPHAVPAGYQVIALDRVDSTSDEAKRRAAAAADGLVIIAGEQTAGRGRLGRSWCSPAGNLYFSLLVRPDLAAMEAPRYTFLAALAVADAVTQSLPAGASVRCKWPNDVLVGGRKVAGILLESATGGSGRVDWLIVGIGINLCSHPPDGEVIYPATDLRAEGAVPVEPMVVLARCLKAFDHWRRAWGEQDFPAIRRAWLDRAYGLEQPIAVRLDGEVVSGTFDGLDSGGALLVKTAVGQRVVTAGDVCLPAPQPSNRG
jgi:BirA family biotin operon repressor/biotin-[acetyl-CoA-carboxylase] ligase